VETRFSISHSKAVFRQTEHEVTHIQLRVDTNLGPAAITCGIAWNLLSDPLHPDTAIRKLMGYQPCPKRNHCYRYVVSLPDPATLGLQLATLEYFGEPKKTISRGLQSICWWKGAVRPFPRWPSGLRIRAIWIP
jgi:hypothetical protein